MNPFLVAPVPTSKDYRLPVVKIVEEQIITIQKQNGNTVLPSTYEYEVEAQQKSFICSDNTTGLRTILYGEDSCVSAKGKDLLLYILMYLPRDTDYIDLSTNILISRLCWKDREKITAARRELQNIGLIALKSNSNYWINPFYIFSGNRIDYFNKYYKNCKRVVHVSRKNINQT